MIGVLLVVPLFCFVFFPLLTIKKREKNIYVSSEWMMKQWLLRLKRRSPCPIVPELHPQGGCVLVED